MAIQQELRDELKSAMRERDQARLDVLRQIETEVANARTAPGFAGQVDDALYLEVVAAYVKKMQKALLEYAKAGERGKELGDKLAYEVAYLSRWLPRKLDEAATRALVRQAIDELGVADARQAGRVIGHVMKSHRDEVDGGLVKRLAAELLADG